MERQKKARTPIRAAVTRTVNQIEAELAKITPEVTDLKVVELKLKILENYEEQLTLADRKVLDAMLDEDKSEDDYGAESLTIEAEQEKILACKMAANQRLHPVRSPSPTGSGTYHSASGDDKKKTYKLPKVEIKKFGGEVTEWLSWWNQFQRIHEDQELHDADKFQYLSQSMVERSKAADLIRVYPQTGENYNKAVKALQDRFGKPKVLKRVYVRELLKMIIYNSRGKLKIGATFDQLEAHLKALESLGITADQMDVILFPMVESCLPDEILLAWQRSQNYGREDREADPPKTEFDFLIEFVKQEVENEGQRELAHSGFEVSSHQRSREPWKDKRNNDLPTAASLQNSVESKECSFCGKTGHRSQDCFKGKEMSMEERRAAVMLRGSCFKCLRKGHLARNCSSKVECSACTKSHYLIMCPDSEVSSASRKESTCTSDQGTSVNSNSNQITKMREVLMKTVHVHVKGTNGKVLEVRLLFDEGSQRSYVKTSVAEKLKCRVVGNLVLQNNLFGGHRTADTPHKLYDVQLQGIESREVMQLNLINEDIICSSCPTIPPGPWMDELSRENIIVSDSWARTPEVEILIGSDLWGALMTGQMKKLNCGLIAVESIFGWTLSGEIPRQDTAACNVISLLTQGDLSIQDMWKLETIGIQDQAEQISREDFDSEVKKRLQQNSTRELDGRYVVRLPWIDESIRIPSNEGVAEKRLIRATEKLKTQGEYQNYDKIFRDWETEGIIEKCRMRSDNEVFLPHRPVFKPESLTTPVRPVFDASCKVGKNRSLNQCLEKGPNMLELIPAILLRFREKKIGVVADIRKAFQMIGVAEEDRNFQKFLWWEDDNKKILKHYRHSRVVFGMNCSPFILAAILELHLDRVTTEDRKVAEMLKNSLYVDNVVISLDDEEQMKEFQKKAIAIFEDAKMELRQWESSLDNSRELASTNVLGLKWLKEEDLLTCNVPKVKDFEGMITKRKVLSVVSQVFDPIGYLCPGVLHPKILLQNSWAQNLDWDKEWRQEESQMFRNWLEELPFLGKICIPRCVFGECQRELTQIHTFCDANRVFARVKMGDEVVVQLLAAKSRLSPLDKKRNKKVTIPRLELMGCLIGSRLATMVKESMKMDTLPVYFWSDSTTALAWIRREEGWGTFVGNRSREIKRSTRAEDWRHVPGNLNPADLPSRGCSPKDLLDSKWWEGPSWLKLNEDFWPKREDLPDEDEVTKEMKKTVTSLATGVKMSPRFSSFLKNVRVAAWIRRFLNNCKPEAKIKTPTLSLEEIRRAEVDVIRKVQECHNKVLCEIKNLKIMKMTDGLLHVDTKITARDDTISFRTPILLPKDDPVVHQLIEYVHKSNCHAGVQFVLGRIREKYWIPQGRKTVSKIINRCVVCKRHNGKGIVCESAPLPKNRTQAQFAFQTTGVDLAGPLILKGGRKAWIVIYTCAVYRWVVLDIVDSISTEQFLESLLKFTWTVGRPSTICSDNGTNFVGAHNLLRKVNLDKLSVNGINWIFNPPTAAWWERLIRTLKELLRKMIGAAKLTRKELEKCLWSISYTINNRPLTTLTEDVNDMTPLTPAMFMRDLQYVGLPEMDEITSKDLREAYQRKTGLRKALDNRFRKEYLGALVQRKNETWKVPLQVGDVVLIGADNKKRYEWPLGRVVELYPGRDGNIRVAKLRTNSGVFLRPLQRLYPLEMSHLREIEVPSSVMDEEKVHVNKEQDEELELKETEGVKKTRSGRVIREPVRYVSWNK
jgi:hypothetical protein